MPVKNRIAEMQPEIAEWRQDIHRHPELMFECHRTATLVAEKLRAFGCDEVAEGLGRTGVVGVIRGKDGGKGRTIALRADMDALPILEATGASHASTVPGAMHACGHDGHTAMLLGAAKYLAETRNFTGTVAVVFQPAEEGGHGALEMCRDGLLERFGIEEVYGMHTWPGGPVGQFAIRPGPFFAASDDWHVTVRGKGGHAAKPHLTTDPVVIASHIVVALQTIVARTVNPVEQAVVSVTSVETSSTATNVIPQSVLLKGTIRTLSEEVRGLAEARFREIVARTAEAFGGTAEIEWSRGYPVMANAEAEATFAAEVAEAVSGSCAAAPQVMGSEDFAYMLQERPGAYILIGNGDSAPVHHPEYDFDDAAIPAGVSYWAEIVERRLRA